MSEQPKPEEGVEYAAFPNGLFSEARSVSAVQSLAAFLDVTPGQAARLLGDPAAYCQEVRARRGSTDWTDAMALLRRRYEPR